MSPKEKLKFDIQTYPRLQVLKVKQKIFEEIERGFKKEHTGVETSEKIRKAVDALGIQLYANQQGEALDFIDAAFIDKQRKLLITLITIGGDITDKQISEIFIVRAKQSNIAVGFFNGLIRKVQKEADILDYLVREDKRGSGIAKELHKYMLGQLRAKSVNKVMTIMGEEKGEGRALLKSEGYQPGSKDKDNVEFYLNI